MKAKVKAFRHIYYKITVAVAGFYNFVQRFAKKWLIEEGTKILTSHFTSGTRITILFLVAAITCNVDRIALSEDSPFKLSRDRIEIQENSHANEVVSDVYRWIQELGSPIYRERQAAFLHLWQLADGGSRENDRHLIDLASRSADLDVAASAKWLQVLMRLSASPSEASKLIEDLVLIRSGDTETILRLARKHEWNHLLAMLQALGPADRVRLLSEAEGLVGIRATIIALAWADHEESRIPEIVDHLWSVDEAIEARRLWHMLGLNDWAVQPPMNAKSVKALDHWRIVLEEINDRVPNAVATARQLGREEKAISILLANNLWKNVIPEQATLPPEVGSLTNGRAAVQAARFSLLFQWSDDHDLSQRWAAAIGSPGPTEEDVVGVRLALSLCGRAEDALAIAKKTSPDEAYEGLIRLGRIEEAMTSLGIERLENDAIQAWLNKQMQKPTVTSASDTELTQRIATLGCTLSRLGLKELARIVDQASIQWASAAEGDHSVSGANGRSSKEEISRERWKELFDTWAKQHRRPFALSQFRQLLREGIDDELRDVIIKILYHNSRDRSDELFKLATPILLWFTEQRDAKDQVQAANDLEQLFTGRAPRDWPGDWHRDGFASLGRSILSENAAESGDDELPTLLARLAMLHHRSDLVKEWLAFGADAGFQEWMKSFFNVPLKSWIAATDRSTRSPTSFARLSVLAEMLVQQKDFSRAIVVYEQLSQLIPERIDFTLMRSECLRSLGETEIANQLRLQVLSVPLSMSYVQGIVDKLEDNQLYSEAELLLKHALRGNKNRRFENWFLALQLMLLQHTPSEANQDGQGLRKLDSQVQIQPAIDDGRRQLLYQLDCFPEMPFKLRFALSTLEMLQRDSARLAILEGDFEAADKAIRACHAISPDIETPIELLPLAEKAFGATSIDAWVELYANPLEEHLHQWPDDTLVGNNLAWFYANIERRLDRGLELSQHVAELLPEDSVYLDTLAEVEFRLGHLDKAVEISSRCRQLTPLESHHRTQLHRFIKAKD